MSQDCIWRFAEDSDISGYTLIVPSVAVGNVAQLACDLLISSLKMRKTASVYSIALIPVIGYDPYDLNSDNISSCCEIYKCDARKLAILQFRAPLIYKYAKSFLEYMLAVLKEKEVKEIIILTSSFAHEKKNIPSSSFRYLANDLCSYKNVINKLGWIKHEKVDVGSSSDPGTTWKIYGGGFATLLYDIAEEKETPCFILFKYCSEGDNIPDAYDMVYELNEVFPMFEDKKNMPAQLIQPVSWKMLFGRPPPQDIY